MNEVEEISRSSFAPSGTAAAWPWVIRDTLREKWVTAKCSNEATARTTAERTGSGLAPRLRASPGSENPVSARRCKLLILREALFRRFERPKNKSILNPGPERGEIER